MDTPILTFFGPYRFLSNFWLSQLMWDGIVWPSSECAYQAAKSLDRDIRLTFATKTPLEAKRAGKAIAMRDDWDAVKVQIMYEIVHAKFSQNPLLKQQLLDTGNVILEEGNSWGDRTWGICPAGSGIGRNELGKILMQIRQEFLLELI
jgi:ribA/ribD-fused uncharacterized protein